MRTHLRPGLIALVVVGGAAGTLIRALLEESFGAGPGEWPWATFAINVGGSFLLGLLVAVVTRWGGDPRVRLALGTGLLGGFTTYSTFVVEVDQLLRAGHVGLGAGYALGSVLLGVAASAAGLLLGGSRAEPAR
ncbi:CrcB family protein [Aeromicrobium sp.]|uniref:CrcB family protein n=1 Tax=Aeromicrobium sp. TaxID=1871063 RepID=UPI0028B24914|nr:CrcB family protein [Aeromicrobium sp.]